MHTGLTFLYERGRGTAAGEAVAVVEEVVEFYDETRMLRSGSSPPRTIHASS